MATKFTKRTKTELMQDIINDYIAETGDSEWDMKDIARWAIKNNRWELSPTNIVQKCAQELSRAARDEYYEDPQGRRVRRKHPIRGEQGVLWADIETAPPEHMKISLQQRRGYIVYDCVQLRKDLDSYNDNNKHGAVIQMCFDFNDDVNERLMPDEYPDSRPEDDEDS